ncbi:RNA polymerase sigma factor [Microbacteriaceae bacterium K1510]|nr:RNA polymerase sigma factor [Microbacteriaceae bacterium K1510]
MKLRQILEQNYGRLRDRLARRFGSADFASEVLHDAYIRLGTGEVTAAIRSVDAYLYRVALNVAADRREADRLWVDKAAIEALRRRDDHELDPEEIARARAEWRVLLRALDELPPRRQAIFVAARFDELPHRDIAERFGVSVDTVDRELKAAFEFFAKRLGKNRPPRRGSGPPEPS